MIVSSTRTASPVTSGPDRQLEVDIDGLMVELTDTVSGKDGDFVPKYQLGPSIEELRAEWTYCLLAMLSVCV
jgi:hypothetical protein